VELRTASVIPGWAFEQDYDQSGKGIFLKVANTINLCNNSDKYRLKAHTISD